MKFLRSLLAAVTLLCLSAHGQLSPPRAASQTEVNTGSSVNTYVSPATLAGYSGTADPTLVTTNSVGGTNQIVSILNGGGTGIYGAFSNYTAKFPGQLVISTVASSVASLAVMRSTQQGDFKYGMSIPAGVSAIGDSTVMDSNIQSVVIFMNGNPTVQTTNQTGDYNLRIANLALYSSGTGINLDMYTNNAAGVPGLFSANGVEFVYVATNAAPGQNKTNIFGSYHAVIANYNSINKGFLVGGPQQISGDSAPINHYGFSYLARDSTGAAINRFTIPVLTAGVSVPDDPNNVNLFMADELNTNLTILGGLRLLLNQVAPNSGGQALNISSWGGTNAVLNSTVDGTTVNAGSTANASGQANFFRYKITADGSPASPSVLNGTGDGLWVKATGAHEAGLAVQGVGQVYSLISGITLSNNVTVSSNLTISGSIVETSNSVPVAVTVGASAFKFTNTTPANLNCYVGDSTAVTTSIGLNGVTIMASTTDLNTQLKLKVNDYITLTYSGGTPTLFTNK